MSRTRRTIPHVEHERGPAPSRQRPLMLENMIARCLSPFCAERFAMNKFPITQLAIALAGERTHVWHGNRGRIEGGRLAPRFQLEGSDGKTYKLSDYRGKQAVVLAWFPKAFTPGCTTECTVMAQHGSKLKKFDVAYFTASVDKPEKNKDFAKSVAPTIRSRRSGRHGCPRVRRDRRHPEVGQPLDVLHRRRRPDPLYRQERPSLDPCRRRSRQAQGIGHRRAK